MNLVLALLFGIALIITGIFLIKKYKSFSEVEGECVETDWDIRSHRRAHIKYKFKEKEYKTLKNIPFCEEKKKYKLRINPLKPESAFCKYECFMFYELIFLGILMIVVGFVEPLL